MDYREEELCIKYHCTYNTIRIYLARDTMANVITDYNNGDRIYRNLTNDNFEELRRLIHRNSRKKPKRKKSEYINEAYYLRRFSLQDYVIKNCPAIDNSYLCKNEKVPCSKVDNCVMKQLADICKCDRNFEINESTTDILKLLNCREVAICGK